MVCCDTTFLVDLIRKNVNAISKLREFVKNDEKLSITVITIAELYYGAYKSKNVNKELNKVRGTIERFHILEMDVGSAEKYGEIRAFLENKGVKRSDRDLFIAAISISHNERAVVTRNRKDFEKIPGITVITY